MQEPRNGVQNAQDTENNNREMTAEELAAHGLNADDSLAGGKDLGDGEETVNEASLAVELTEAKDKYLRLAAEFENYKRRMSKERMDMFATAGRDVLQAMLPVLDDTDRAAKTLETATDVAGIKEGVMLVFNKLRSTLQGRGLKAMESTGTPFDPELHEAITEVPVPSDAQRGFVIDTIEPGYYLNDKLIRHAKVVVGK